MYSAQPKTFVQ